MRREQIEGELSESEPTFIGFKSNCLACEKDRPGAKAVDGETDVGVSRTCCGHTQS